MLKRAKLSTRVRALLVAGVVTVTAVQAALAAPAPSAHIVDPNSDGWLNRTEVAAGITVTGTYDTTVSPAITHIRVFVVNSASCDLGAGQVAPPAPAQATLNADGTWSAGPFDISGFSENAVVCARARASDDGGVSYTELAISDNKPIKDTIVLPGTVAMIDPNNDGWVNLVERTNNAVRARWTANPALNALGAVDAKFAQVWFEDAAANIIVGCEKTPATITGPGSGEEPLRASCIDALPNYGGTPNAPTGFTFHAAWADAAGNTLDALANPATAASSALIKDTEPPRAPTVAIVTTPLNKANIAAVTVSGNIPDSPLGRVEAGDRVDIAVSDGTRVVTGNTVADGTASYSQTFNLAALSDRPCNDNVTYTDCISATAFATDLAGNVGPSASAHAGKDATPPAPPSITINPNPISVINQSFVEFTVCSGDGELGTRVTLVVDDDQAPGTLPWNNPPFFLTTPCRTVNIDVSNFHDGVITAVAFVTDSYQNPSAPGIATALKDTTLPAITIESPAAGSFIGRTSVVTGTAIPGAFIDLYDNFVRTVDGKAEPVRQKLNAKPDSIVADANAKWSAQVTYTASGTHTLEAVTNTAPGVAKNVATRTFDVDAINPSGNNDMAANTIFQRADSVVIKGEATDDFSGVLAVKVKIFEITKQTRAQVNTNPPGVTLIQNLTVVDTEATCTGCAPRALKVNWSYDATALPPGYYTVHIFAVDYKGNQSTQPSTTSFVRG